MKKYNKMTPKEQDDFDFNLELDNAFSDDMRPASDVLPADLFKALVRGKQKAPTKVSATVRFDEATLNFFKKSGKGWQTRMNDVLTSYAKSHSV